MISSCPQLPGVAVKLSCVTWRPARRHFVGQHVFHETMCQVNGRFGSVATRKYEQRLRAEVADETRRRILEAVHEQLRGAPSQPVSVDRVARMAGLARSAIYLVFGSRAGLFDALGADLLQRGGFERMVRAAAHQDAREGLRGGIRGCALMFAAHRDVLRA